MVEKYLAQSAYLVSHHEHGQCPPELITSTPWKLGVSNTQNSPSESTVPRLPTVAFLAERRYAKCYYANKRYKWLTSAIKC